MIRSLFIAFFLLLALPVCADEVQVNEIYETYLPPEKLIPVLEPMLGPEDRITAFRNKLIVHAPRARQDKLLELLEEIDRPLKNIQVEVRYGNGRTEQANALDTSVEYRNANKGVEIGSETTPDPKHIVVYSGSSQSSKIKVKTVAKSHFSTEDEHALSQIRVLEGHEAFLQVGDEVPVNQYILLHPNGFGSTTQYHMVGNGIYVVPRIVKNKVRLELFTTQQKPKPGNSGQIEKTDAQSVLLVDPDIWTPFAGASIDVQSQGNDKVLSTRNLKQGQNKSLEVKVTILD